MVTHGVFPDDALVRLQDSGLFERIIYPDTHPRARQLAGDFLTVKPIGSLIWQSLQRVQG